VHTGGPGELALTGTGVFSSVPLGWRKNRDPAGRETNELASQQQQPRKKTGRAPTDGASPNQRKMKRGCRGEGRTDRATQATERNKNSGRRRRRTLARGVNNSTNGGALAGEIESANPSATPAEPELGRALTHKWNAGS
jgi:hypothetical protein